MELMEFIFRDIWHFAGTILLMMVAATGIAGIAGIFAAISK